MKQEQDEQEQDEDEQNLLLNINFNHKTTLKKILNSLVSSLNYSQALSWDD